MFLLLNLIINAVILRLIAAMSDGVRVDGWSAALAAALIMTLAGLVVGLVAAPLMADLGPSAEPSAEQVALAVGLWRSFAIRAVADAVGLLTASAILPGIGVRNVFGLVSAVVVLTIADFGVTLLIAQIAAGLQT